jgi:3-hydroxyacyl-CoA dehydrogenase
MLVKNIAVIGAGPAGRDIACAAVLGGYFTVLEDLSRELLERAVVCIRQWLDRRVVLEGSESGVRREAEPLLSTSSSVEDAIRDADLIIEAAPEEMEMKLELFTVFDKFAKPGAIFASASALPITDMSDMVVHRERCIGLHFSAPALVPRHLELVRTPFTSEETVAACREVARRMGRAAILLQDGQPSRDGLSDAHHLHQKKAVQG